jgi:hypothetical protein
VDVVVVNGAEGNREFITDFKAEALGLRVAHVVSVGGRAPTNQARLTCYKAEMLLAANSLRFPDSQSALVDFRSEGRCL